LAENREVILLDSYWFRVRASPYPILKQERMQKLKHYYVKDSNPAKFRYPQVQPIKKILIKSRLGLEVVQECTAL